MKVWYDGKYLEMSIGQEVTIYCCHRGSGQAMGERAILMQITKRHLIFITDSGAVVKTKLDNLHAVVGHAKECGYCVSPKPIKAFPGIRHEKVRFWDKKSCTFVKK